MRLLSVLSGHGAGEILEPRACVRHVPLDEDFEDWPEPGEAGAAVDAPVDVRAESDQEQETDAPNQ